MTTYNDIIITPVYGPLNTSNTPNISGIHNLGTLTCSTPNPPLFYPSQEPVNSDQFINARRQYIQSVNNANTKPILKQNERPIMFYSHSTQHKHPVSTNVNYIPPQDSSSYISRKKSIALGKSSFKIGLPKNAEYTTKNYYPSGVQSTIRRVRSSGCVAPAKKGSIFNTSLNTTTGGLGSAPRQTY